MGKKKKQVNYDIVVLSDEWNGLPFSCKHLLSHFLPDVPLIWVETIGLRSPGLNLFDIKRAIKKLMGWLSKREIRQDIVSQNLYILDPLQVPYNQFCVVRELNKKMVIKTLKDFRHGQSNGERVLITTWPFIGNIVGSLGELVSIYYRVDDFSEYPGVSKNYIRRVEEELIRKVDMVVASAENLTHIGVEDKVVRYLPHGVDFEHFAPKNGVVRELPIQRIPKPRIGFFGLLDRWIDIDLLSLVAANCPTYSFVFIGPSQLPSSFLPKAPNIHFLGPISYEELPFHARHFDVGLIPFKVNRLTKSVNPLKLMEYFSMGLPVVSTPIPEVTKYGDSVTVASDPQAFGMGIRAALDRDNKEARLSRRRLARTHSWKQKSLELRSWIEEALEQKIAMSN